MQEALNQCINPERPKEAKEIADTIYLLKNVTAPGVIVECGFLSNQAETAGWRSRPTSVCWRRPSPQGICGGAMKKEQHESKDHVLLYRLRQ